MGNRMSSFPVAVHCGLSAKLGETHGASLAALQSSAYHARMAGLISGNASEYEKLWPRLTTEMREECEGWSPPNDFSLYGVDYSYKDALVEFGVTLYSDGTGVLGEVPSEEWEEYSIGHVDMAWEGEAEGRKIVVIGDAKRTRFTSSLSSLQLDAYGWAYASAVGADGYIAGIWVLADSEWAWRNQVVWLDDLDSGDIAQRLMAAMRNTDTAITGEHCSQCYSRGVCPEYLIPAGTLVRSIDGDTPNTAFEAFETGITAENAKDAYELVCRAEKLVTSMRAQVKAYALESGGFGIGRGMEYSPSKYTPPPSIDTKKLKSEYPAIWEACCKPPGNPSYKISTRKAKRRVDD